MAAVPAVLAALVVVAGGAKLRRPASAHDLIPGWVSRPPRPVMRLIGAVEVALGVGVLVWAGPLLVGVLAAAYLAFTGVALIQRRRGASCGCFGDDEVPVTWAHVGFDLVAALTAAAAVVVDPAPLHHMLHGPVELLLGAALVAATAQLLRLLLTGLPELTRAVGTAEGT